MQADRTPWHGRLPEPRERSRSIRTGPEHPHRPATARDATRWCSGPAAVAMVARVVRGHLARQRRDHVPGLLNRREIVQHPPPFGATGVALPPVAQVAHISPPKASDASPARRAAVADPDAARWRSAARALAPSESRNAARPSGDMMRRRVRPDRRSGAIRVTAGGTSAASCTCPLSMPRRKRHGPMRHRCPKGYSSLLHRLRPEKGQQTRIASTGATFGLLEGPPARLLWDA